MEEDPDPDVQESALVYPKIENIYSNAANIKTEPVDCGRNSFDFEYESSGDYYPAFSNKIILGSKPPSHASKSSTPETSAASSGGEQKDQFQCDQCLLSFSTKKNLDYHKMSHSSSVARLNNRALKSTAKSSVLSMSYQSFQGNLSSHENVKTPQKAVKSTAKSSILNKSFPFLKHKALKSTAKNPFGDIIPVNVVLERAGTGSNDTDKLLCGHCGVRFPNEIALIKHTYELIPEKQAKCGVCHQVFNSKPELRGHMLNHFKKAKGQPDLPYLQCVYCFCLLKYPKKLKQHMLTNHKTTECVMKRVKFTGKCVLCSRTFPTQKQYNEHISRIHAKVYSKPHKPMNLPGLVHKKTFGPARGKLDSKMTSANTQKLKPKMQISKLARKLTMRNLIPKQNLFKCNKCQIHFVTCSSAFEHSKRCVLAKGDWKCNKCRRSFTNLEQPIHTLQHEFSDKFKVHTINEKVVSRVLCRCPKCELHFDEKSFWTHVSLCFGLKNGVDCSICKLKIHVNSCEEHRRSHSEYNHARADYIVIEFFEASSQDDDRPVRVAIPYNEKNKRHILFCSKCKTHVKKVKDKSFHSLGHCKKLITKYCLTCGLLFTHKTWRRHTIFDHKFLNFKLADFIFMRIEDYSVINPPVPEFIKCDKCSVRFGTRVQRNQHCCETQIFTKCPLCSQKYDPVTYSLHLPFHDYCRSPTAEPGSLIPKSEIFFSCVRCSYGFNSYDNLVEHCQQHYTGAENLTTIECKICNLNYTQDHKNIHSDSMSFKILQFYHDNLLAEDWTKGFDAISQEEIEAILSKSVYSVTRNVRLVLSVDGPPERSLYKCAKCQLCIEPESIAEHTRSQCNKAPRYKCTSCEAAFPSMVSQTKHTDIHVVFGDDIVFREIIFNDIKDRHLNDALWTSMMEALKFRKCQNCGLFINKNEYQDHIDAHIDAGKEGFRLLRPVNANKKYTVYQCSDCKSCVMNKVNIRRHNCGNTVKCKKCSLRFRTFFKIRHDHLHNTLPKFVKSNITVIEFELNNSVANAVQERKRYSTDDVAPAGSLVFHNTVTKTHGNRKSNTEEIDSNNVMESENSQDAENNKEIYPEEDLDEVESAPDMKTWRLDKRTKKLYQCQRCFFCFIQKIDLVGHQSKCKGNKLTKPPFTCNLCDTTYHPSLAAFHELLHEYIGTLADNSFFLFNVPTKCVDESNESKWLYKCKFDDVHYLTTSALEFHFENNHQSVQGYFNCNICQLKFTQHTLKKHLTLQHNGKWTENSLNIAIGEKKSVKKGDILNLTTNTVSDNDVRISARAAVNTIDMHSKGSETASEDAGVKLVDIELGKDEKEKNKRSPSVVDNTLYKCVVCSIHFLKKHTLNCHVRQNHHYLESTECDICGLKFGIRTLEKHKSHQHKILKLKRKDIIITTMTGELVNYDEVDDKFNKDTNDSDIASTVTSYEEKDTSNAVIENSEGNQESEFLSETIISKCEPNKKGQNIVKYAPLIDKCSLSLSLENKLFQPGPTEKETLMFRVYQCKDCRVCVQKNQRKLHVCCSDIQKKYCIKCSLSFRRSDFNRHVSLHKKHLGLSRKNFLLTKFGHFATRNHRIYKCVVCSTHFVSWNALEWHMDAWNHQTKKDKCEMCGLYFGKFSLSRHVYIHHTKLNLSAEQFSIVCVSTANKNISSKENGSNLISSLNTTASDAILNKCSNSNKKMFKCFECAVYFLTQSSYYQHIYKHTKLDPTEYIACKMCELQFLTEDLREHMRNHKDKSFNTDKLLIQGYLPNTNELIESCFAAGNIDSKLVSTTTPFDNETERVSGREQLSTVDSTSDGINKVHLTSGRNK